jgi:D-3-phosphoglycerate dehydrogenase
MKILINLPPSFFTHPQLSKQFEKLASMGEVRTASHNTPEEIIGDLKWADAVIMWSWPVITAPMLASCPQVKYIGQINTTQTTAKACLQSKIALSEARHAWSPAVAEMALTLTLAGLRKTSGYHIAMRNGTEQWVKDFPADIDPQERELSGANVGIVGFGRIGQRFAELIKPFNTITRVFDPYLPKEVAESTGVALTHLDDLLSNSEVVVLCAANTEETTHLLGEKQLGLLQQNSILINVGRSSLVDMQALQKRIAAQEIIAMLDVFDTEPLESNASLRSMQNAFLTPHRAGGVLSSIQRALTMLSADLEAAATNKPRQHEVTEKMLPCFPEQ